MSKLHLDNAFLITREFISNYYPSCELIFLTGSIARETNIENSDIDLLIIDEVISRSYMEQFLFNGEVINVTVLPLFKLEDVFLEEYNQRQCAHISLVSHALIVKDTLGIGDALIQFAKNLFNQPLKFEEDEFLFYKFQITNCINDLSTSRTFLENTLTINRCIDLITYTLLTNDGQWPLLGKQRAKPLEISYQNFAVELKSAFKDFVESETIVPISNFFSHYLRQLGGAVENYSSRVILDKVINNQLSILLSWNSSLQGNGLQATFTLIEQQLLRFFKNEKWFLIRADDHKKFGQNDFILVINGDTNDLNLLRAELLRLSKQSNGILDCRIELPLNVNHQASIPDEFYGDLITLQTQITKILLQDFYIDKNKISNNVLQTKALTISVLFIISLENNLRIEFLSYLNKAWLSDSVDNRGELSYMRIKDQKIALLHSFKMTLNRQKGQLLDLIKNVIHNASNGLDEDEINKHIKIYISKIYYQVAKNDFDKPDYLPWPIKFRYYRIIMERIFLCFGIEPKNRLFYAFVLNDFFKD